VQPCLELEEVQVTPRAAQPVVGLLAGSTTGGAGQQARAAADFEVDALARGVQLHILDFPRRHQPQRAGEQRFNPNVQTKPLVAMALARPMDMWTARCAA
jgi:hypothetical protein